MKYNMHDLQYRFEKLGGTIKDGEYYAPEVDSLVIESLQSILVSKKSEYRELIAKNPQDKEALCAKFDEESRAIMNEIDKTYLSYDVEKEARTIQGILKPITTLYTLGLDIPELDSEVLTRLFVQYGGVVGQGKDGKKTYALPEKPKALSMVDATILALNTEIEEAFSLRSGNTMKEAAILTRDARGKLSQYKEDRESVYMQHPEYAIPNELLGMITSMMELQDREMSVSDSNKYM